MQDPKQVKNKDPIILGPGRVFLKEEGEGIEAKDRRETAGICEVECKAAAYQRTVGEDAAAILAHSQSILEDLGGEEEEVGEADGGQTDQVGERD